MLFKGEIYAVFYAIYQCVAQKQLVDAKHKYCIIAVIIL